MPAAIKAGCPPRKRPPVATATKANKLLSPIFTLMMPFFFQRRIPLIALKDAPAHAFNRLTDMKHLKAAWRCLRGRDLEPYHQSYCTAWRNSPGKIARPRHEAPTCFLARLARADFGAEFLFVAWACKLRPGGDHD